MIKLKQIFYAVFALALIAVVFTTVYYRAAWNDEGQYLDPGANLALGRGFISSGWDSSAPSAVWGSSTPAFPLFFALLFKVFGFNLWVARVALFSGHLIGALLLIRWAGRNMGMSDGAKLCCLIGCLGAPAISYHAIYHARLECFALLFCAWFMYLRDSWESSGRWSAAALLGFGCIIFLTGLHFCVFFAIAALMSYAITPRLSGFRFGLTLACGMIIGLIALRIGYGFLGVWDDFIAHRSAHYGKALPWVPTGIQRFYVTKDLGIFAIGCLAVLVWELSTRYDARWKSRARSLAYALGIFFSMPLLVSAVGIWHAGYAWMVGIPMVLFAATLFLSAPRWPHIGLATLGLSLAFAGLYREIRKIPRGIRDQELRQIAAADFLRLSQPGEALASTYEFFYEVRGLDREVFFRVERESHLSLGFSQELYFPKAARAKTQWLLSCVDETPWYLDGLGGKWDEVRRYPRDDPKGDYQLFKRRAPAAR